MLICSKRPVRFKECQFLFFLETSKNPILYGLSTNISTMLSSYMKRLGAAYLIYAHVERGNCESPEPLKKV